MAHEIREGLQLLHGCRAYHEFPPPVGSSDERLSRERGVLYMGGNELRTEEGSKRHPARCTCGFPDYLPTKEQRDKWEADPDAALCCGQGCTLEVLWYFQNKIPIQPTSPGEEWARAVTKRLEELEGGSPGLKKPPGAESSPGPQKSASGASAKTPKVSGPSAGYDE